MCFCAVYTLCAECAYSGCAVYVCVLSVFSVLIVYLVLSVWAVYMVVLSVRVRACAQAHM